VKVELKRFDNKTLFEQADIYKICSLYAKNRSELEQKAVVHYLRTKIKYFQGADPDNLTIVAQKMTPEYYQAGSTSKDFQPLL